MHLRLATHLDYASAAGVRGVLAPRDAALLAWLAIEGPTTRARLAQLMWPEHDDDAARNSLRQRLFQLRRQVGADLISGTVTLNLAEGVGHDLADSHSVLGAQAPAIGSEFDAWLARQRERRRSRQRQQQLQQLQRAEDAGDYAAALAGAQDWLAAEPQLEDAHRAVMRLHYLLGDRAAALATFKRCEQQLAQVHGARPGVQTLALHAIVSGADAALSAPPATVAPQLPAGVLRPPRLVGRDTELAAIDQGWAAGCIVALVGDAGIGKSRLLRQVLPAGERRLETGEGQQTADAAPRHAVAVAARPGDAGVPLATLARLLRAVTAGAALALEPAVRRELGRALPEWGDGAQPAEGHRLLLHRAVRSLLAQQRLAYVAIDDLHFADSASLEMLTALLVDGAHDGDGDGAADPRAVRLAAPTPGIRWLLAYRPAETGSAVNTLQAGLEAHALLQRVALSPLDKTALAVLVDSLGLPGVDGAALAAGLLQRTGGNPLFVLETLKQAWVDKTLSRLARPQDPGGATLALPRPQSVMRLIGQRIAQLSPLALSLARCAAVAGQDFTAGLASQVLAMPALALADAWAELESAQILRDQAFVHDLYFEAALASVPRSIARHLHGQIAQALEADAQVPAATLARHWLAAAQPQRAAPHLARAAQAAGERLAPADAAGHWHSLAALHAEAGDAKAAFDAAHQAVLALRSTTSGDALASAIEALDKLACSAAQRATAGELRAGMLMTRGDAAGAAACLAQALASLGDDAPAAVRVSLLNMRGVLLRRQGQGAAAREALEQALAVARGPGGADADLPAVLNNLGLVLQEQDGHVAAIGLMQQAIELQRDPLERARVQNNLAISLEEQGLVALALEHRLGAARATAGAGGVVELNLAISLGGNACTLGRYRDALAHLTRARALLQAQPHFREHDLQRHLALLWLELGRVNLAREALDLALRLTAGRHEAALVAPVHARLLLQQGGDSDSAKAEALALLQPAALALQSGGSRRALRRLWVLQARCLPPADALVLMQGVAAMPGVHDNAAACLPVQVRLAQAELALGRPGPALRHAQRAADWLQAVWPAEMKPSEVQMTVAQCALAVGDPALAAQAAAAGRDWVRMSATEQLDELYREAWLQRNPVNAALLALAARLTAR